MKEKVFEFFYKFYKGMMSRVGNSDSSLIELIITEPFTDIQKILLFNEAEWMWSFLLLSADWVSITAFDKLQALVKD